MQNPELDLAFEFIQFTNKNIFLTGKAGTGKTTFLHHLKKVSPKRMVVVAPTGVAAINAGGVTIHSFFQLPYGPHVPDQANIPTSELNPEKPQAYQKKFNREKIRLIQSLDLLVIDEISMVRADMLDAIDMVLKKYKDRTKPFGGVQLLMIGDLHQLSPVVKEDEWNLLKKYYDTVYFFSSKALQQIPSVNIELKHIYRQSDEYFINILNKIRNNQIDAQTLTELNQRYIPNFSPDDKEGYIVLTTHNASAHEINQNKLKKLKSPSEIFGADTEGEFPPYSYPTEQELELKEGAQVMFVKNDSSPLKCYYNGKIGKISRIDEDEIYVKCPDEEDILVKREEWQNVKYFLDEETKEVKENVIGTFTQYPLKLAWAITIHKSQGLTFEKAIIDANASFAHGQVYVALSRCKNFEGMVLSSPITIHSVKTDNTISAFTNQVDQNPPGEKLLNDSKKAFQKTLLHEMFDFKNIKYRYNYLKKVINENSNLVDVAIISEINAIEKNTNTEIYSVSDKFKSQLERLIFESAFPEESNELQERVKKAAQYFSEKIETILFNFARNLLLETDNKAIKKIFSEALENLQKNVFVKLACLKSGMSGFVTIEYLKVKSNAEMDFISDIKTGKTKRVSAPKNMTHAELYAELKKWRDETAEQNNSAEYLVLPYKTMKELVAKLPVTLVELEKIKGIGKRKVSLFGNQIISIISDYCETNKIEKTPVEIRSKTKKTKEPKPDTKKISLELFQSGKTIQEIARERQLTPSTIENHLVHFVETEKLDIFDLISKEKFEKISEYLTQRKWVNIGDLKIALGEEFSYNELKMVAKYLANN